MSSASWTRRTRSDGYQPAVYSLLAPSKPAPPPSDRDGLPVTNETFPLDKAQLDMDKMKRSCGESPPSTSHLTSQVDSHSPLLQLCRSSVWCLPTDQPRRPLSDECS